VTPLSVVRPKSGKYKDSAGVVESVERDDAGKVKSVTVDMDADRARVKFKPDELTVLKAH
jgi:uncharacterized lipoprotein YehR (DUF1307 family)